MASPMAFRGTQCVSCTRHIAGSLESAFQLSAGHQQVRGIKKLVKGPTTKVHLLRNVPKYGAKGTVVSIPAGTMRNRWYPNKIAEYMTTAKMNELGVKKETAIERDSTFASEKQRKILKKQQAEELANLHAEEAAEQTLQASRVVTEEAPVIELKLFSPEEGTAILEELLPPNLEFYRTPVAVAPPVEMRISPSIPTSSVVSAAANAAAKAGKGTNAKALAKTSIFGSVSTNDIATNLKAILAENSRGALLVFGHEDISFVEQTSDDKDRVKHLGIFEIEIRLKGAPDVVRRTIQVQAQA